MLRTVSIKLAIDNEQSTKLQQLQKTYTDVCNQLVPYVIEHRCWNRVALHKLAYHNIRMSNVLGSQMVCNTIYSVCKAYKSQKELGKIKAKESIPQICFRNSSILDMILGQHQLNLLQHGTPKEAELIYRNNTWYFNLVLEIPESNLPTSNIIIGIDVGENNIAAISTNKIYGGGKLKHKRDKYLALRRRLQSNGSKSAKQLLNKISGKEQRFVKHINHVISKKIIENAIQIGANKLIMEDLTHIRSNIKAGKRIRSRLHRWSFRQLQTFVEYKAKGYSIQVEYVDPAYSSKTCSNCHELGSRKKHIFKCKCGFQAHADYNASQNLAWIGSGNTLPRATVNPPNVGSVHSCTPSLYPIL